MKTSQHKFKAGDNVVCLLDFLPDSSKPCQILKPLTSNENDHRYRVKYDHEVFERVVEERYITAFSLAGAADQPSLAHA